MNSAPTDLRTPRRLALVLALAMLGCLWVADGADAGVYWGSMGSTVGRADSDGGDVEPNLITGASQSWGVAVDATHLYWANFAGHSIGRAKLDGSEVDQSFIGGVEPMALAVAGDHIYWTDDGPDSIGRAALDGSGVEKEFIAGAGSFAGLAANSEFLYWGRTADGGTIGRARLDGSDLDLAFIDPAGPLIPYGVAASETHVYWANSQNDSIGRADAGGCEIEEAFVAGAHPAGVAVDAHHVYWGRARVPEAIGRADLDGSDVRNAFVPGATAAFGLAVDVSPARLSTAASPGVNLGGTIHGTAILAGANNPTGTITFDLHDKDQACGESPLATYTVPAAGNGSYQSARFTPTRAGTYYWRASYSGDLANDPLVGVRSAAVEVTEAPAPAPLPTGTAPAARPAYLALHVGKRTRARRAGRAKVTVGVSAAGKLTLSGKHVRRVSRRASAAGRTKLAVIPTGAFKRRLGNRAASATLRVTFTSTDGSTVVRQTRIRLARSG